MKSFAFSLKLLTFFISLSLPNISWYGVHGYNTYNEKPNIFFILLDDWGHFDMDLCERKDVHTPNMNRLAREGVYLNNYYVAPLCTPSRASLMTGAYVHRTGLQNYVIGNAQPMGLPLNFTLLPEHMQNLGYTTRMIGKWHLGFYKKEFTPTYRGFDSHYGFWNGNSDHFTHRSISSVQPDNIANFTNEYFARDLANPNKILIDGHDFRRDMDVVYDHEMQFLADLYCQEFMDIISNHDQSDPLFMYMAQHSVHRGNEHLEMKAPYNYTKYFPHIKDRERMNMAGSLLAADICLGKMIKTLFEANMLRNSIIIVSSDNGSPTTTGFYSNGGSNYPYLGNKGSVLEGGIKVQSFIWSPLIQKRRNIWNGLMHITDWLPTLYSAAGGDIDDLGEDIDGMDMWDALSRGTESPRNEILIHHDSVLNYAAIRRDNFKLVTNYGVQVAQHYVGNRTRPSSNVAPINPSRWPAEARLTDRVMNNFHWRRPNFNSFYCNSLKTPLSVTVDETKACKESDKYCLFDLDVDPYETTNIADQEPLVVQFLLKRLKYYDAQAIPAQNVKFDFNANPYFHGDQWVTYRDPENIFSP